MSKFNSEQEKFWAGDFGDQYSDRNRGSRLRTSNIKMFEKILSFTESIHSVIEFGANIGLNLRAVRQLLPDAELSAVEINMKAVTELKRLERIKIFHQSIFDFSIEYQRDFVFTKGVLIHINPNKLNRVYDLLYQCSKRYVCIAEYYNPTPVELTYRGHKNKLFKRDFAGEMLDRFKDLRLVAYSFVYHRDYNFPQDDITWFLMEKTI
jgi:spore coat polysaccharide biosynthesis protein SpsF